MARYHAKKRLGQNFLKSEEIISSLVELVEAAPCERIIEVGPGRGALTLPLARLRKYLIAVEFDRDLIGYLNKLVGNFPNVEIVNTDFLTFDPESYSYSRFTLVGNIPYNITSPVIEWCTLNRTQMVRAILMVQKEMARRISAEAGTREWSPLSIFTQLHFDVRLCFDVPASAFRPAPNVASAVIELLPKNTKVDVDHDLLEKVVRTAFKHRRKLLMNNLVPDIIPSGAVARDVATALSLSEKCRAEELSIDLFLKLTAHLAACNIV